MVPVASPEIGAFLPLVIVALVCGITPGPSTLIAAGIGAGHGFARAIPHIAGTAIGYATLALVTAGVLHGLARVHPMAHGALQWLGAAAILWLAWRIARASAGPVPVFPPLGLWASSALQWVNPKAWATAAAAASLAPEASPATVTAAVALSFALFLPPGVACCAAAGCVLRAWLQTASRRRFFNGTMSGALVVLVGLGLATA